MWRSRFAWLGAVFVCRGLRRLGTSLARGLLRVKVGRRAGHVMLAVARSGRCGSGRKFPGDGRKTFTCTATPAAPTTPSAAPAAAAIGTFRAPLTGWPRSLAGASELGTRRLGRNTALALAVVAVDVALAATLTAAFAGTFAGTFDRRLGPPAAIAIAVTLAMIAPAIPVASVAATVALTARTVRVAAVARMLTATVAALSVIAPWSASRARSTHLGRRLGRLWSRRLASEYPLEA